MNGSYRVTIKTLHGKFFFPLVRCNRGSVSTDYFRESGQFGESAYETMALRDYGAKYSTLLSYKEVEELLEERCGAMILSDQRLHGIVGEEAQKIGEEQKREIAEWSERAMPLLSESSAIEIYDSSHKETILMEDGISVAKQKTKRNKERKIGKERSNQDIVVLECLDKSFKRLVAAEGISLTELTETAIKKEYKESKVALSIVVISDGATSIRNRYQGLFGSRYYHILDWYHLQKKCYELLSMIAQNKQEKESIATQITGLLWRGKSQEVLEVLDGIKPRNAQKLEELKKYITKNHGAIIDYERRQKAGKTIGSGFMEKTVHLIVGVRQKGQSKSWSPLGSNNLAVLSAKFFNKAA